MATQTFMTPIKFNQKNAKQLSEALQNDKAPKLTNVSYELIREKEELDIFFDKKAKK